MTSRNALEADAIVLMYPLPSPSPDFELVGPFDSVDEALQWTKDHPRFGVTPRLKEMRKHD